MADNFEQMLMEKYPDLFYRDETGALMCPCGVWTPVGWRNIIENTCGAISDYITKTHHYKHRVLSKWYYYWIMYARVLTWLHRVVLKYIPLCNIRKLNQIWYSCIEFFNSRARKYIEYYSISPPAVKIDQIKEKFGELRFYISGGDSTVGGMIRYAEYMCSRTCESTGGVGELCSRDGWLKTLSANTALQLGYKPVEKQIE